MLQSAHGIGQSPLSLSLVFHFADVVDERHGAHENFARRKGRDDADAHLPIESKRPNHRLNQPAEPPAQTLAQIGAGLVFVEFLQLLLAWRRNSALTPR